MISIATCIQQKLMANKLLHQTTTQNPSKATVEPEDISKNRELKFTNLMNLSRGTGNAGKYATLKYHSPALEKFLLQLERKIPLF